MYAPSFFGESDGIGQNVVLYYQLKDHGAHVSPQALGLLQRFFADGTEENGDRTRERLKYVPRIANLAEASEDLKLSRPERNLMKTYDGKPVMTRPQHRFYQASGGGVKWRSRCLAPFVSCVESRSPGPQLHLIVCQTTS